MNTLYKRNTATRYQIVEHFKSCDFKPRLETYVEVSPYVDKILNHAERFECWDGKYLIGLVAAYCNNLEEMEAFITMVSVSSKYNGRGIAKELLSQAISYCKKLKFVSIKLEVASSNAKAVSIYEKFGFERTGLKGKLIVMENKL